MPNPARTVSEALTSEVRSHSVSGGTHISAIGPQGPHLLLLSWPPDMTPHLPDPIRQNILEPIGRVAPLGGLELPSRVLGHKHDLPTGA